MFLACYDVIGELVGCYLLGLVAVVCETLCGRVVRVLFWALRVGCGVLIVGLGGGN